MNIQNAKEEIKNTLRAYHLKDAEGRYLFPSVRQRPILLMGPPGIGKTAILQQVAEECGVGLVAYTLTHHTRQSAVGLPHIEKKYFDGEEMSVTEYTMSEIIGAVYDYMERTGKREGILFLDEVNCVSETLAPTMLELLQNKTFGGHKVPEGWILVTAGNPPEYNKSVREFDVATLDRVRTIPVEPDSEVWLCYAREKQVHNAVCSYLTIRPDDFYLVEDGAEKTCFVTARGWEDLSELLKAYETLGLEVTQQLVSQYLQQEKIAGEFAAYYQIYRKYQEDYALDQLLEGRLDTETRQKKIDMAKSGGFEERFTVAELLADVLSRDFAQWQRKAAWLQALYEALQRLKRNYGEGPGAQAAAMEKSLQVRIEAGLLKAPEAEVEKWVIHQLEYMDLQLKKEHIRETEPALNRLRELFSACREDIRDRAEQTEDKLKQAFWFIESCFGQGQEMTLFMTELTRNANAMAFIAEYGSDDFLRFSDVLMFESQEEKLRAQCKALLNENPDFQDL